MACPSARWIWLRMLVVEFLRAPRRKVISSPSRGRPRSWMGITIRVSIMMLIKKLPMLLHPALLDHVVMFIPDLLLAPEAMRAR
jgi:hypothetical protein